MGHRRLTLAIEWMRGQWQQPLHIYSRNSGGDTTWTILFSGNKS